MKKSFLLLIMGLYTIITSIAASSKGKSGAAPVIGEFYANEDTFQLLEGGEAQSIDGSIKGRYEPLDGYAYKVKMDSYEADFIYLIVGDVVYEIGVGSSGFITDFDYNPEDESITILEIDFDPVTEEDLEYMDYSSPVVPLTALFNAGNINWTKSPVQSSKEDYDSPALGIMSFCKMGSAYEGPSGKSTKEIIKVIEEAGYEQEEPMPSTYMVYDDIDDEELEIACVFVPYTKGDSMISCYFAADNGEIEQDSTPLCINILELGDGMNSFIDAFVADAKKNGFVLDKSEGEGFYLPSKQPAGVSFNAIRGEDASLEIKFHDAN